MRFRMSIASPSRFDAARIVVSHKTQMKCEGSFGISSIPNSPNCLARTAGGISRAEGRISCLWWRPKWAELESTNSSKAEATVGIGIW